jgi:hypothetical protein
MLALVLAEGLQAVAPDCRVVVAGILVAGGRVRVGVAEEYPAAPEPGVPAIHQVIAADRPSVHGDTISQVVPASSEAT